MPAARTSGEARPLLVLEGAPGCARPDVDRLRAAGFTLVDGLHSRVGLTARTVCVGIVDDAAAASQALLAALDGAGLVIEARAPRDVVDRLVDDLRRLGAVDHRVVAVAPATEPGTPSAPPEAREIIALLAEGYSLGEAAAVLGLSRRTADRRLAAARDALGVERTTEAVARARLVGWLPPPTG